MAIYKCMYIGAIVSTTCSPMQQDIVFVGKLLIYKATSIYIHYNYVYIIWLIDTDRESSECLDIDEIFYMVLNKGKEFLDWRILDSTLQIDSVRIFYPSQFPLLLCPSQNATLSLLLLTLSPIFPKPIKMHRDESLFVHYHLRWSKVLFHGKELAIEERSIKECCPPIECAMIEMTQL